jgi:hypothetical protein
MKILISVIGFLKVHMGTTAETVLEAADTTGVPAFPPLDERVNMIMIVGMMIAVLILLLSLKIYQLETDKPGREEGN